MGRLKIRLQTNSFKTFLIVIIAVYVNFTFVLKQFALLQYLLYYTFIMIYLISNIEILINWLKGCQRRTDFLLLAFLSWMFILLNSVLFPLLHGTLDFSYMEVVLSIFRNAAQYLFLLILIKKSLKPSNLGVEFMQVCINSALIYIFITTGMVIFPDFKDFWRDIVADSAINVMHSYEVNYFTRYGLAGFSGFRQTLLCTVFIAMNLYLISREAESGRKMSYKLFFSLGGLLIGNTYYGRSGLMISVFCIAVTIVYITVKFRKIQLLIGVCFFLISIFSAVTVLKNYNEQLGIWYNWALKPVTNFLESGKIGTETSDIMFEDMYFLPEFETVFLGDAWYTEAETGGYYRKTDTGYMRPLLFYGIFNQGWGYLTYLLLLAGILKGCHRKRDKSGRLWVLLSGLIFLIFELKGEVFYILTGIYIPLYLAIIADPSLEEGRQGTALLKRAVSYESNYK